MKALILALSTYSRIPMPQMTAQDYEKARDSVLLFFPVVGLIEGLWQTLLLLLSLYLLGDRIYLAAIIVYAAHILITGGIHLDGYMDMADARASHAGRDRQLEIMKDPSSGAFAVIALVMLTLLRLGMDYELISCCSRADASMQACIVISLIWLPFYVRVLSARLVVSLPKARKWGMAAEMTRKDRNLQPGLKLMCIAGGIVYVLMMAGLLLYGLMQAQPQRAAVSALQCAACAPPLVYVVAAVEGLGVPILCLASYHWHKADYMKRYGGVTGDMAGEFLERTLSLGLMLLTLAAIVIGRAA